MGEIADMLLEGIMCEGCGEYLDQEGDGFPDYCSPDCAIDRGADWWLDANGYDENGKKVKK